jgi:hypothetical protein
LQWFASRSEEQRYFFGGIQAAIDGDKLISDFSEELIFQDLVAVTPLLSDTAAMRVYKDSESTYKAEFASLVKGAEWTAQQSKVSEVGLMFE